MDGQILEKETIDNTSLTKMKSNRKYDIIVFGASGFTGRFVAIELAALSLKYNLTWAVAGRDLIKLQKTLDDVCDTLNYHPSKTIDVIYADVQDVETIMKMALTTNVIINCVGPYYIYGEVVVKSCVLKSTHYVDVTGESLFMEKMAYLYNGEAEKSCSIIVNALGMDSVPADLGVEYLYKHFTGDLHNVDIYMKLFSESPVSTNSAMVHDGTWASAILHLATVKQRLYYRNLLDTSMGITRENTSFYRLFHRQQITTHSEKKKWCLAFPEPDQAVILRSIHHAKTVENLPYNFKAKSYMVFGNLLTAVITVFIIILLSIFAIFEPIKNLLIKYPKLFSLGCATKTGPNEKLMENSQMSLTIIGYGSIPLKPQTESAKGLVKINNRRKMIVKVNAKNPGYGFTSKAVVLGAITLLKDHNIPKGGVLTPAAAFRNSQYINMLMEHNAARFEIESDVVY